MDDMMRMTWTLAFIMRDIIKYEAVDLSKLPESDREKIGVMYALLDKQISEVEHDS